MQRTTKQREIIEGTLVKAKRPLSPSEIYELACKSLPNLSLGTVYRNLRTLSENDMIRAVPLPGEPDRYESLEAASHHHHHFQCDSCRKVFDVEGCSGSFGSKVPKGFIVKRHELTLYGLCGACK